MLLRSIDFTHDESHGAVPDRVTVTLTAQEVVYLAKLVGRQNADDANSVSFGGAAANSAVYECLTGDVANPYFDDGIDDMARLVRK